MAKAPSARVHKTSGQGVSRRSYQTAYDLRRGEGPRVDAKFPKPEKQREYGKKASSKSKAKPKGGINVSYGDTLPIGDLEDIERYPKR